MFSRIFNRNNERIQENFYSYSQPHPFHPVAHQFVASTKKIAQDILQSANSSSDSSGCIGRVHVHHHHGYSPLWYRPVYVLDGGSSSDDKNDRAFRVIVGICASVIGAIAFYTIGTNITRYQEAQEEIEETKSFRFEARAYQQANATDADLDSKLERICTLREKIFKRILHNAIWDLATATTLAVGSTIAVVGALIASYALMTGGTALGLGIGAVIMIKWGMDSTDKKHQRNAHEILSVIGQLPRL